MAGQLGQSFLKIGNGGLNGLLAERGMVIIHFWVLLVKLNNFTFDFKAVLFSESTILDGRPACRPEEAPSRWDEAGAWAELGKTQKDSSRTKWRNNKSYINAKKK